VFHIVVATHGKMAIGLQDTLNMFMPNTKNISFLSFLHYDSIDTLKEKVQELYSQIQEDEILVLNDIVGGTPFNVMVELSLKSKKKVEFVGGVNLPMVLNCLLSLEMSVSDAAIKAYDEGKNGVVRFDLNALLDD